MLHLDGPALAWEYLRRNPAYRLDWQHRQSHRRESRDEAASGWGLRLLEDPARDAREAEPLWIPGPDALVLIRPDDDPPDRALPFQLWRFPGRKYLIHDGKRLCLTCEAVGRVVRVAVSPALSDGMAHTFALPASGCLSARWRATGAELAFLEGEEASRTAFAAMPSRCAMLHMRALQALDGILAGASQRDVAEVLYGRGTVAEHWDENCDMRARVRRLIRRGRKYMAGGYQRLLRIGDT